MTGFLEALDKRLHDHDELQHRNLPKEPSAPCGHGSVSVKAVSLLRDIYLGLRRIGGIRVAKSYCRGMRGELDVSTV